MKFNDALLFLKFFKYIFSPSPAYSFDGLVVFGLLVVCTCAYMRRVPRLKQWFLSEKKGFFGVFYKGIKFSDEIVGSTKMQFSKIKKSVHDTSYFIVTVK